MISQRQTPHRGCINLCLNLFVILEHRGNMGFKYNISAFSSTVFFFSLRSECRSQISMMRNWGNWGSFESCVRQWMQKPWRQANGCSQQTGTPIHLHTCEVRISDKRTWWLLRVCRVSMLCSAPRYRSLLAALVFSSPETNERTKVTGTLGAN